MKLTLEAPGYESRQVTIGNIQSYSEINRVMGLLSEGIASKTDGEDDQDGDGVFDSKDDYPNDPARAFKMRIPTEECFSIAFEDLFGGARTVDADYNDFIAHYYVYEIANADNKVVEIEGHATAHVKWAGYNHNFGLVIDSFNGDATLEVDYTDKPATVERIEGQEYADILLFTNTDQSVGQETVFTLTFDIPQIKKVLKEEEKVLDKTAETVTTATKTKIIDLPPYNPYLYVWNTGVYVHMIGELGLPELEYKDHDFRDENGYPWALLVPSDWNQPGECEPIWDPYPRFLNWVASGGEDFTDWYLHEDDPYEPPVEPVIGIAADINSGSGSSKPANLQAFGSALFFAADGGDGAGLELWKYDGSSATRVTDIYASGDSSPAFLTVYGSNLYFSATYGSSFTNVGLYKYNGSASRIPGVLFVSHLGVSGNLLYFQAADDPISVGAELWSYNGSTTTLIDINSGSTSSYPYYPTEYSGELYFQATATGSTLDGELWSYNGSTAQVAAELIPGAGGGRPTNLIVYNGNLYFRANDGNGWELWRYDGSSASPLRTFAPSAQDLELQASPMVVYDGALYFCASDGSTGLELWRYDGTSVTQISINDGVGDGLTSPTYFAEYDAALFFNATDGTSGVELWRYAGTTLSQAADINAAGDSSPSHLEVWNGKLYFQADDGVSGAELWAYEVPSP
jgi:LruC domain-containing protein